MHPTATRPAAPPTLRSVLGLASIALLLVAAAACGGGDAGRDAADADAAATGTDPMAGDLSAGGAAVDDGSARVGIAADDDGTIADGAVARRLTAGDALWVSVATAGAEPGSAVEVVWYDPEGLEAAVAEGRVEGGAAHQAFAADTTGWAAGVYRGEVWVGNELVEEVEVEVGHGGG